MNDTEKDPGTNSTPIQRKSPEIQALFQRAIDARKNSHSPYSRFAVGAAARLSNGKTYSGCNVENSSYGGTTCAEQVSILKAVSEEGKIQLTELMIVTDANPVAPPCGLCLQVISEFVQGNAVIYLATVEGKVTETDFRSLYPHLFSREFLPKVEK